MILNRGVTVILVTEFQTFFIVTDTFSPTSIANIGLTAKALYIEPI